MGSIDSRTPAARRATVIGVTATVVVVAVVAVVAGIAWLRPSSSDGAARAAQRYVDLIASGDRDELADLDPMTAGGTPALADAAALLAAADERIEVLSVGDPRDVDEPADLPEGALVEDLVEVQVRYRLAGEDHTWPLVLGQEDDDWRVASPMVGSIDWQEPGLRNVDTEIRLGETVLERRPRVQDGGGDGGGDETVQPLYPAVYQAEKRIDPYFASTPASVAVLPGAPSAEPSLTVAATDATREALATDFATRADSCGGPDAFGQCPFFDLVRTARAGGDPSARGWWRGLTEKPTITVDAVDDVEITGSFRYLARDGVRTMRFTADGEIGFEAVRRTPTLAGLDVEQAD